MIDQSCDGNLIESSHLGSRMPVQLRSEPVHFALDAHREVQDYSHLSSSTEVKQAEEPLRNTMPARQFLDGSPGLAFQRTVKDQDTQYDPFWGK
jgi:hypothetical protein